MQPDSQSYFPASNGSLSRQVTSDAESGLLGGVGGGLPSDGESAGGGLRRQIGALYRFKWLIILIVGFGSAIGLVLSRKAERGYMVESKIWLNPSAGNRGPITEGQLLNSQAWIELLRSFAVLDYVVVNQRLYIIHEPTQRAIFENFNLQEQFRADDYVVTRHGEKLTLTTGSGTLVETVTAGDSLGRRVGFAWVPNAQSLPAGEEVAFRVRRPRDAARELAGQIQTWMASKDGNFIQLELRGTDREQLAKTLNAVTKRFVDLAAELKRQKLQEFANILGEQLQLAEQNLASAEIELESFKIQTITLPTESGTTSPTTSSGGNPLMTSFMTLKLEQDQIRKDRISVERAMARARDSVLSVAQLEAIASVQGSSELRGALNELTTKRASLRALQYHYTDEHSEVRKVNSELAILEHETIPQLVHALTEELGRRDAQLEGLVGSSSEELRKIPPRVMEESRLKRQVAIADNLYTMLRQRHEEAHLAALSSSPDLRILDPAALPNRPVRDTSKQILLLAFGASLGIAVVGVLALENMDRRVRYPEQITQGLRLPIIGAIPTLRTGNGVRMANNENTAQVIESFRSLRLSLLHAAADNGFLMTAISSPGIGDGKSFVAVNLALAFAEQGYRTLLVDGDIRRGGLHRLLARHRSPGLTDMLAGNITRDEAIQTTGYAMLDLVGCGTRVHSGPELLGSASMVQLLRELRSLYEVVLIDTPPLGAGVDPLVVGTAAGNLLLVVRTGITDREFAEAKLSVLDRLPIRIVGAIMNGVPEGGVYRYYTYLSGYQTADENRIGEARSVVDETDRLPVVS